MTLPRVPLTGDTSGQPGDTQNLACPGPASAPTLALVPTVKGTLWEQKATHCVTLRQRGRGQRLRTPGLVTTAPHATHSLGQREALGWGWGDTLEFPGQTLSFREPWSHHAPAGQRSRGQRPSPVPNSKVSGPGAAPNKPAPPCCYLRNGRVSYPSESRSR